MKAGIIMSLLAMALFATSANAQTNRAPGHIRVFDGSNGGYLAPVGNTFRTPLIDLAAGKPIRIEFGSARGDEKYFYTLIGTKAEVSAPEIPCDGGSRSNQRRSRGGNGRDVLLGGSGDDVLIGGPTSSPPVFYEVKMQEIYVTSFQTSAGRCRLVNVKLANGAQYRGLIRFR